jgi:hypothetical protein
MVAIEDGPVIHMAHLHDKDFSKWLQLCGINRTLIITDTPPRLPDMRISS